MTLAIAGENGSGIDSTEDEGIDLDGWLERIGYSAPLEPTLDVLREVVKCYMAAIPFEAIDVLLGRGIDLAPAAIDRKLLAGHRGGYCFEHASLMRRALQAIGFPVEQHLARVRVRTGLEGPAPRPTHASLKVEAADRRWLVDVGFGGFVPNAPLIWQRDKCQHTAYGDFRLTATRDGRLLESLHRERWWPLYEILDFNWQTADFEVANHYTATHPESNFRRNLMVALTGVNERTTLAGNRFKRVAVDGSHEEHTLDAAELADVLASEFGLPVEADWRPLLEQIVADSGTTATSNEH